MCGLAVVTAVAEQHYDFVTQHIAHYLPLAMSGSAGDSWRVPDWLGG
jgi:hypothetical protein